MGMAFTKGLFYGKASFTTEQDKRLVDWEIRTKQIYGAALVWINYLLVVLAGFISLISGYCTGGQPVTFGSMPHHVWYIPSLVILPFVLLSFYFDSTVDYTSTSAWLVVGMWFVLFLAAINLIHGVALIIELVDKTSIFYQQNSAAWVIVLLVASFIFVLWEAWIAWRMYVYRHDVIMGQYVGWRPGMALEGNDEDNDGAKSAESEKDDEENPPPNAPEKKDLDLTNRINFSMPSSYGNNTKPGMIHAAAARVGLVTTTKPKDN